MPCLCSGVQPAEITRYVTCSRLFSMIWNASPVDLNFISICSLTMRRLQNFSMVQMLHIQGLLWWHGLIVHQRYSSSSEWWWFFTNFLSVDNTLWKGFSVIQSHPNRVMMTLPIELLVNNLTFCFTIVIGTNIESSLLCSIALKLM